MIDDRKSIIIFNVIENITMQNNFQLFFYNEIDDIFVEASLYYIRMIQCTFNILFIKLQIINGNFNSVYNDS